MSGIDKTPSAALYNAAENGAKGLKELALDVRAPETDLHILLLRHRIMRIDFNVEALKKVYSSHASKLRAFLQTHRAAHLLAHAMIYVIGSYWILTLPPGWKPLIACLAMLMASAALGFYVALARPTTWFIRPMMQVDFSYLPQSLIDKMAELSYDGATFFVETSHDIEERLLIAEYRRERAYIALWYSQSDIAYDPVRYRTA